MFIFISYVLIRFSSDYNKQVQLNICDQIQSQPESKFTEKEIKGEANCNNHLTVAVRRCYENLRRVFLEHQSGKEDMVEHQSKMRKYRSRRERVNIFT